jgi:DNA-binding transcriptional ArsR family regulator
VLAAAADQDLGRVSEAGDRSLVGKNSSTDRLTISSRTPILNHMVELHTAPAAQLDAVFHALGDATRRRMLRDLSGGQRSVGELAAPFDMSLAAASKHIKALEKAGLVRRQVQGRTHICRLEPRPLEDAHEWVAFYERFWTSRLDVLEGLLRGEDAKPKTGEDQ